MAVTTTRSRSTASSSSTTAAATTTNATKPSAVPAAAAPGSSVALNEAPVGRSVSGRTWKKPEKTRFSAVRYKGTKVLSTSWEQKAHTRARRAELQALQSEIKVRRQGERDVKRQAREEKEKRRQENELKSASVQVVRGCVAFWLVVDCCC